jgi:hypothetical protein
LKKDSKPAKTFSDISDYAYALTLLDRYDHGTLTIEETTRVACRHSSRVTTDKIMTKHKIYMNSYRDLANGINDACEWLSDHGLHYSRTRMGEYKRHLNELADYWEQGRIDELLELRDFPTLLNSCHEASELSYIFTGLSSLSNLSITTKLHEFIKGPPSCKNENASSSNRSRNIAFELYVAARLAAAGFVIDLTKEADIIVVVENYEVFIECKRPQKNHQVNSNLKGALSQLERRYPSANNPEMARGIIAVAIGKILNPDLSFLREPTPEALTNKLSLINKAFIDAFDAKWRNPSDKRTIGVLVYLGIPAVIESQNTLNNCHELAMTTTFTNDHGLDVLTEIRNKVRPLK